MKRKVTTDDADAEFGDSSRYWYAILSVCMKNQDLAEAVIQKILDFKEKHRKQDRMTVVEVHCQCGKTTKVSKP